MSHADIQLFLAPWILMPVALIAGLFVYFLGQIRPELGIAALVPVVGAILIAPVLWAHEWAVRALQASRSAHEEHAREERKRKRTRRLALTWLAVATLVSLGIALISIMQLSVWNVAQRLTPFIPFIGGISFAFLTIEPCRALSRLHRMLSLIRRTPRPNQPPRAAPTPAGSP